MGAADTAPSRRQRRLSGPCHDASVQPGARPPASGLIAFTSSPVLALNIRRPRDLTGCLTVLTVACLTQSLRETIDCYDRVQIGRRPSPSEALIPEGPSESVPRLCPAGSGRRQKSPISNTKWSGARDLNPGPHGPEPCRCHVLLCLTDSCVVLSSSKSNSLVSFGDLLEPSDAGNA